MATKAILKVGFYTFLLPDSVQAAKVLEALSKAVLVHDRLYKGVVKLAKEGALELELKIVPANARFVKPAGEEPEGVDVYVKKQPKRRNGQRTFFLEDRQ